MIILISCGPFLVAKNYKYTLHSLLVILLRHTLIRILIFLNVTIRRTFTVFLEDGLIFCFSFFMPHISLKK